MTNYFENSYGQWNKDKLLDILDMSNHFQVTLFLREKLYIKNGTLQKLILKAENFKM